MTTTRKYALWGGLLYLLTFAASLPTLGLKADVVDHADFVLGSGSEGAVIWGSLLDVVCGLAGLGTAVALYPVIKRFGRGGSIGFIGSRTVEAAMLFVGALALLSIVTLRQDATGSADSLVVAGQSLLAVHDWSFLLGPGVMPALNALFLGTVLYRSGLVPRTLPTLGLIGAPLLLASSVATMFGAHDQVSSTALLAALPIATWELSLGVYLTVKGFRPEPAAAVEAPAPADRELVPA
jgi:hypothetical protein